MRGVWEKLTGVFHAFHLTYNPFGLLFNYSPVSSDHLIKGVRIFDIEDFYLKALNYGFITQSGLTAPK